MLRNQLFFISCLFLLAVAAAQDKSLSCSTFRYELLAARLDSLETVATKLELQSTDNVQRLRSDIQELTRNIQNLVWGNIGFNTEKSRAGPNSATALPQSCSDVQFRKSGVYLVDTSRGLQKPFEVFCDQDFEGGGWLVFQNRFDGAVDFYRSWNEYKDGFGSLDGEFWLGLEKLHQVSYSAPHELAVVIEDFNGEVAIARYTSFAIGGESEFYSLNKLGTYNGTANDALAYHSQGKFSTFDRDNDEHSTNCAVNYIGAWWYKACHQSNLNSRYLPGGLNAEANKIVVWRMWKGDKHALKKTRMMIRRIPL